MVHTASIFKAPTVCWAEGIGPRVLTSYPWHSGREQDGGSNVLFWLFPDPATCHTRYCRTMDTGLSHRSPLLAPQPTAYALDAPIGPSCFPFPPPPPCLFFPSCLIKKHLLAIHCLSEQNLYFRHVEPCILNSNSNVERCLYYIIPFLFVHNHTLQNPTGRQMQMGYKNTESQDQQKEIGQAHLNTILFWQKAEFKAEGTARHCACFAIALLTPVLHFGKKKPQTSFIKFLCSCLHPKVFWEV